MTEHAVVIAGGGPTGLMLAGELALAGVDVAIVERRASQDLPGSRAGGLHSRTIEVLDQRGIAERFLSEGQEAQVAQFASVPLDISDFPTRHPYGLGLWQNHIERILAGWVDELAVTIHREREVTGFAQDDTGVDVELADGMSLRAEYPSGATEDAASSGKLRASSSRGGIRRRAASSPRSRWPRNQNRASAAAPSASMPSAGSSTRSATARWSTWTRARCA
jgi:flavin-dependent dehydrogenase